MIDTLVFVSVKPECVDAFIAATLENQRNSRKEPANIRFDVLREDGDPTKFVLCEVYADAAGAAASMSAVFATHRVPSCAVPTSGWTRTGAAIRARTTAAVRVPGFFFGLSGRFRITLFS